jgi:hypothetical protein
VDNISIDGIDDFDFPIGKRLENESDGFLLDTSRGYIKQLAEYKAHRE